jgi:serine/threonine-protein kinase
MARVFVAEDSRLGRRVVVKVLAPELAAGISAQRFEREILLTARLQHPHILPVHSAGMVDGLPYYTMPYVEGESLRIRLAREGALRVDDAVRLIRELADALSYAHGEGVVHRDLKPENVLLSGGHAVVADFGIAKALSAATRGGGEENRESDSGSVTAVGGSIGTPAYMAPEQIAADPAIDHRADLYALGVIAYELLAGVPPFVERSPQALFAAHLTQIPVALVARRPEVPMALATLVMQLLAKVPDDRPATASAVLRTLDGTTSRYSAGSHSSSAIKTRWSRWRLTTIIATSCLVLAVGGGVAWYRRSRNAVPPDAKRVLVVPFENATGDRSLTPFGRMAADWIAQGLSQTGAVQVSADLAQSAVGESGLKAAAAENGAGTVVSGAYYLDGDSVRLQARVTNVDDWTLLRAVSPVSAPRAMPTALLEALRQRVMAVIVVAHDPRSKGWDIGAPPPTYDAYEQFLTGLDTFAAGDWRDAIPYWDRATGLDSTYALPMLHISQAYFNSGEYAAADSVTQLLERRREKLAPFDRGMLAYLRGLIDGHRVAALEGARAMVRAAPGGQLPYFLAAQNALFANRPREALAAAAHVSYSFGRWRAGWSAQIYWRCVTDAHHLIGDHVAELNAARTARVYLPENREALSYELRALAALGRTTEVESKIDELQAMPAAAKGRTTLALIVWLADELSVHGHSDAAHRVLQRGIAWQRGRPADEQRTATARVNLAQALYRLGDFSAADTLFAKLVGEQPADARRLVYLGLIAGHNGQRVGAERVDKQLTAMRHPYDRGQTPYARALIAANLGDTAKALGLLSDALAEGIDYPDLHADARLLPLRNDSRFQALIKPRG